MPLLTLLVTLAIAVAFIPQHISEVAAQAVGFTPTGSMGTGRGEATATLLSNGKVLVVGGDNGGPLPSAELYDPSTGFFTATGSMGTPRFIPTATRLPNEKVLVAGGWTGGNRVASTELYDPATGLFAPHNNMNNARQVHTATVLPDGKILLAGGNNILFGTPPVHTSAELYDPSTGFFTATGSMGSPRHYHTATLLPNGKVLVVGGHNGSNPVASAELYDPVLGTFSSTNSMGNARYFHTATLLPNGKVLVTGGAISSSVAIASAELYDPATGVFTPTGSMGNTRSWHTATLLPNGKVLVAGGPRELGALATAQLYDPATGGFTNTNSMGAARWGHTGTLLTNGKVLVASGYNPSSVVLTSAELFTSPSTTVTVPALTNITVGTSGATAAVNVLNVPEGNLGAYQFQVSYNVAVVQATGVLGGAAPFNAVTAVNITNPVSGTGVAKWNHFQGTQTPVSTASHHLASVVFQAVGTAGACSPLTITVVDLVNNQGGFIPNTNQGGQVCLVGISALAQTDLKAALDVDDIVPNQATGVKATIDQITSTVTGGGTLPGVLIASYEANVSFPSTLALATACRLKPPINLAPSNCSILAGSVHLKAASSGGMATPIDPLAFVALRLTGSNIPATGNTTVNLNFVEIKDTLGSLIPQATPPDTRTFLRGDALADGGISIGDALYIGQHLVNPTARPAGEGPGKVNPVNAGSVNHDSPNDVISLADAIKIAQFLVGNLNEFYNP